MGIRCCGERGPNVLRGGAMRRIAAIIGISILLTASGVDVGFSQDSPKVESVEPEAETRLTSNGGRVYLDLGIQSGYLKGDTTYHIDFPGGASELEFPLETYLVGPELVWGYRNPQKQDQFVFKIKWLTNIDNGSGKMKDSDWLEGDGHPGLDIYSESDVELQANILDVNVTYNLWPTKAWAIGPIVGYRYEKFEFNVKDTEQVGYGPYAPGYTVAVSGKTLDYVVTYHIPYLGVSSSIRLLKGFSAEINAGYSPITFAEDRDDHILRYKLSKGDTDGYSYFANANAVWNFLSHWFLIVGAEYLKIHTTGEQHQSFYAGPDAGLEFDVDDKITSKQTFLSATVIYRFW